MTGRCNAKGDPNPATVAQTDSCCCTSLTQFAFTTSISYLQISEVGS